MERQEARDAFEKHLREMDRQEHRDAQMIREILAKHSIDSEFSNMSSSGLSDEQLQAAGRFLLNRVSVGHFRKEAAKYLEWVDTLRKPDNSL